MNRVLPENLLLLGKVLRPHGLDGVMRIQSYAQSADSFLHARKVFLGVLPEKVREFEISSIKPHKNVFLLKLKGVDSIEAAEEFRGVDILILKDSVPEKAKGEYFWFELVGLDVYLEKGSYIGTVKDILVTGSNDIYVVRNNDKETLIPAIEDVVVKIDLENNRMIIADIEGLLDLNAV